jgi:dihydrofolate reductase
MKASVFVGTSLDGFIARVNGEFDFLPAGGGEPHGYEEFMATVDALVIGRKTFETVLRFATWPYREKRVVVLSTRALASAPAGAVVERMFGTPASIVSRLSARGVRHVYVDGGITIQRFLRAGLIQRLIITRVPVLIGSGIPLFGPLGRDIALEHVATRPYASGLVQSEYEVKNAERSTLDASRPLKKAGLNGELKTENGKAFSNRRPRLVSNRQSAIADPLVPAGPRL